MNIDTHNHSEKRLIYIYFAHRNINLWLQFFDVHHWSGRIFCMQCIGCPLVMLEFHIDKSLYMTKSISNWIFIYDNGFLCDGSSIVNKHDTSSLLCETQKKREKIPWKSIDILVLCIWKCSLLHDRAECLLSRWKRYISRDNLLWFY